MKKLAVWTLVVACAMVGGDVSWARNHSDFVPSYAPLRTVIKPQTVRISPDVTSGHVVVKFRRGADVDRQQSRISGSGASGAATIIALHGMTALEAMVPGDVASIRQRRMAAEDRAKMNLPDMSLYYRTPISSAQQAEQTIRELNALDEIEIAYFEPLPEVASYSEVTTTPSWEGNQHYIDAAPDGVDARAAWTLPGGDGTGIQIFDVEFGWQLTHEDLSAGATAIVAGVNSSDNDHGTAVLGEMVADRNGFGMTGISYNADIGVSSVSTQSVAQAINSAVNNSEPGDLILIELHAPGPHFDFQGRDDQLGYVPMEYWQSDFDAMVNAYANGVIVCEAAGNGHEDLDDDNLYLNVFDTTFRNSHAIMCGAGNPPVGGSSNDRSKLGFSNWGERVNLQGYGVSVYTCGYADLYSGGTQDSWYTESFSGTSSASPIVTGSVASLSGVFKNMLGSILDADSALALLVPTGSPQQSPNLIRHIGPRPNLAAAIAPLFDPIDSIVYGDIDIEVGEKLGLPITLTNSHPVGEIYLPFKLSGTATIVIDSLTRGPRTADFEEVQLVFDNRFSGEAGYVVRADAGGGTPFLPADSGVVAYLWVRAHPISQIGQTAVVDSAWLGSTTRLRLTSEFDDGYPDGFTTGSISIVGPDCACPYQSNFDENAVIDAADLNTLINVLYFNAVDPQDPDCPKTRSDFNCDDISDSVDLSQIVSYLFFNGPTPCDPCAN